MASVAIEEKAKPKSLNINNKGYPLVSINEKISNTVSINEFLPFRIRITDIDIVAFGTSNVPPIPLQIIGISNYIL